MSSSIYQVTAFGYEHSAFPQLEKVFGMPMRTEEHGQTFKVVSDWASSYYAKNRNIPAFDAVPWGELEEEAEIENKANAFQLVLRWIELHQVVEEIQIEMLRSLGWERSAQTSTDGWTETYVKPLTSRLKKFDRAAPCLIWDGWDLEQQFPHEAVLGIPLGGLVHPILLDHDQQSGDCGIEVSQDTPKRLELVAHLQELLITRHDQIWQQAGVQQTRVYV